MKSKIDMAGRTYFKDLYVSAPYKYTHKWILIGPFLLRIMTTTEDKNIPSNREQSLIQVQLIFFITICDYAEEKKLRRRRKKRYPTHF